MMNCRRGDVVLVMFPDSNLRTSKREAALVVQADQLGADLPQTIVAAGSESASRRQAARAPAPLLREIAAGQEFDGSPPGYVFRLRSWARSGSSKSMNCIGVTMVVASKVLGKCLVLPVTR